MTLKLKVRLLKDTAKYLVSFLALTVLQHGGNTFLTYLLNPLLKRFFDIRLEVEKGKKEEEITICRYKNGAKGALCISIDFDLPTKPSKRDAIILRNATAKILQLAEHYKIPLSWGICGKLAVQCPKVFEQIVSSSVNHDLGIHTFSHIDLSSPTCSVDAARTDILKCKEVLDGAKGPVSFIFPKNREGHFPLLRKLGFIAYRGKEVKIAYPSKEHGLWNIHQSYYLSEKSSKIETYALLLLIWRFIDSTIANGLVFHIWTHPWSMNLRGSPKKFVEKLVGPFLGSVVKKRDNGLLWICTMRDLANYCEARRNCQIETFVKEQNEIRLTATCSIESPGFDFPPVVTLKIQLPSQSNVLKVLVNEKEVRKEEYWHVAKKWGKKHLFLTLSFESPANRIQILTKEY